MGSLPLFVKPENVSPALGSRFLGRVANHPLLSDFPCAEVDTYEHDEDASDLSEQRAENRWSVLDMHVDQSAGSTVSARRSP
jgi:hypothetical protein